MRQGWRSDWPIRIFTPRSRLLRGRGSRELQDHPRLQLRGIRSDRGLVHLVKRFLFFIAAVKLAGDLVEIVVLLDGVSLTVSRAGCVGDLLLDHFLGLF